MLWNNFSVESYESHKKVWKREKMKKRIELKNNLLVSKEISLDRKGKTTDIFIKMNFLHDNWLKLDANEWFKNEWFNKLKIRIKSTKVISLFKITNKFIYFCLSIL